MAKLRFQDIVPPEKRSIKKIPIPDRSHNTQTHTDADDARDHMRDTVESKPPKRSSKKKSGKLLSVFIIFSMLAVIGFGAYFFIPKISGATVKLTPKGLLVSVDAQFKSSNDQESALPYQIVSYEKSGKMIIPASGEEKAEIKASGVIRIFNNFSTAPQKLVANTRFETPEGKIFRISEPVTVPGKTGDKPGSLEVTVTADKAGPEYNVGLMDFTIPGFKGDPRYEKIFARSKTPLTGGFSGMRKKVNATDVTKARSQIREELLANISK